VSGCKLVSTSTTQRESVRATTHSLLFSWVAVCLLSKSPHLFWPRKARQLHKRRRTAGNMCCCTQKQSARAHAPLQQGRAHHHWCRNMPCVRWAQARTACARTAQQTRRALVCFFHITRNCASQPVQHMVRHSLQASSGAVTPAQTASEKKEKCKLS
jgi:hypothetical protein